MGRPSAPCKGCPSRIVGCHSNCRAYGEYKQADISYVHTMNEIKYADKDANNFRYEQIRKYYRKRG